MQKYDVVPPQDERTTYDVPELNAASLYYVLNRSARTQTVVTLNVFIRKAILNWAPNGVIRVEGYTETTSGMRGVLGYYRINSTDQWLGELQVQDI